MRLDLVTQFDCRPRCSHEVAVQVRCCDALAAAHEVDRFARIGSLDTPKVLAWRWCLIRHISPLLICCSSGTPWAPPAPWAAGPAPRRARRRSAPAAQAKPPEPGQRRRQHARGRPGGLARAPGRLLHHHAQAARGIEDDPVKMLVQLFASQHPGEAKPTRQRCGPTPVEGPDSGADQARIKSGLLSLKCVLTHRFRRAGVPAPSAIRGTGRQSRAFSQRTNVSPASGE